MANWDVIVIGLGGVGSAAAFQLAANGHRVLGIDQFSPVHSMGSSHGQTRIIRQAYFEHPSYVPLLRRAYQLWDKLEHAVSARLFYRTGLVEMGPKTGVVIPGVLRSASEHGLDVEQLSCAEVTKRWPGLVAPDGWQAVIERDAGYLRVEACVDAHLQLAESSSATLMFQCPVLDWCVEGNGVRVTTDRGSESASRLVIAAGPWSSQLLGKLGVPLTVLRKYQYWYDPDRPGYEQSEGFPCFFHETPTGYFYGFPSNQVGVKVSRHSGGTEVSQPGGSHPSDAADQALVEDYLHRHLPGVGRNCISQAGCYYTVTPDENFIVDRHPEADQIVVVAGLSGHGFKFTSVLGELASQLVTGQTTSLDTSLLRFER